MYALFPYLPKRLETKLLTKRLQKIAKTFFKGFTRKENWFIKRKVVPKGFLVLGLMYSNYN